MPRDARAYLEDVLESCDAITMAVYGLSLDDYRSNRLVRSSVEREFTIIGEAVAALAHIAPDAFASITQARRIVDFRNQLTHEYASVNDAFVWGLTDREVRVLRNQCAALMDGLDSMSEGD